MVNYPQAVCFLKTNYLLFSFSFLLPLLDRKQVVYVLVFCVCCLPSPYTCCLVWSHLFCQVRLQVGLLKVFWTRWPTGQNLFRQSRAVPYKLTLRQPRM